MLRGFVMALRIGLVGLAFASAVAGAGLVDVRPAHADEAFLCGPDTVVYVKPAELELKKRTDPCIAAYYGLQVEPDASAKDPAKTAESDSASKPAPVKETRRGAPPASNPVELKRLPAPEHDAPGRAVEERSASLLPPVPTPGTDYRNVRVINASSPGEEWYRHLR